MCGGAVRVPVPPGKARVTHGMSPRAHAPRPLPAQIFHWPLGMHNATQRWFHCPVVRLPVAPDIC
jgi:hypothetical protein